MCLNSEIIDYAEKYNLKIETDNNKGYTLYLRTDFEIITLKLQRPYKLQSTSLLRFLPPSRQGLLGLLDDSEGEVCGYYFLPSHKEDSLMNDENDDFFVDNESIKIKVIPFSKRHDYSTSFFKVYSADETEIKKTIADLKKQIYALKDSVCMFGVMPYGYGIIEESNKERTKNPTSVHSSFWKTSKDLNTEATFFNISKNFYFIT